MATHITLHWTAGVYTPNSTDKSHYHYLVAYDPASKTATVRKQHPTSKRLIHTYQRHTNNVAISICGMREASPTNFGSHPMTPLQVEAACFTASQIALIKGIPLEKIKTHAEYALLDGYFLGDPDVDGDWRWDIQLKSASISNHQRRPIVTQDGNKLRARIEEYLDAFDDKDQAFETLVKLGPIYRFTNGEISGRGEQDQFSRLGAPITPFVLN